MFTLQVGGGIAPPMIPPRVQRGRSSLPSSVNKTTGSSGDSTPPLPPRSRHSVQTTSADKSQLHTHTNISTTQVCVLLITVCSVTASNN